MFREIILPIFRNTRLCVTVCGTMHPRCCRPPPGNIVGALFHSLGTTGLKVEPSLSPLPFDCFSNIGRLMVHILFFRSNTVLGVANVDRQSVYPPQKFARSLTATCDANSQHDSSCPPAELAEFESSAKFGPFEGAVRKAGRLEWQFYPVPQLRSHQYSIKQHRSKHQNSAYSWFICGVFKLRRCEFACKSELALNCSSVMWGLQSCQGEVEFVALCGCSDMNVYKLYRLCAAHSYVRYIAKVVAIYMCLS